ncbi:hypothetical protein [Sphingomonas sp. BAUL-RG-20F-R05-02]|uniref:hypothetical protein n=1 Tax=Sphingomonas sp. BAUL-RG-20F-R05-02 TaxID=2914830 RepID=UPI001F55E255|nr:hypothetical protein [Sphingomonas sp. BAUL-RG-20F-R05-02]
MGEGVDDPRRRGRAMVGWTKRMRGVFLDALALGGNVRQAAEAAGGTHDSAYALRRRDPAFAEGWDAAVATVYARLEAELLARAIGNGPVDFDAALALKVLARHEAQAPRGRMRAGTERTASLDTVERSLTRKLAALAKRMPVAS